MEGDVIRIELSEKASAQDVAELAGSLHDVPGVVDTSADTRALSEALVLVQLVGGALTDATAALGILRNIVGKVHGKGLHGARIELPDGTKIEVDHASVDEIERIVAAATAGR